MEKTFYTKENHDLNIMDIVNLGIVVLITLKNTIIFILAFFLLLGFLSTSTIEPQFRSESRLLIELPNINLKDEQNIDFSSLNAQAIQTEIEKIKSNALLHNVIIKNNIEIPKFEISNSNSPFIIYLADRVLTFSGVRFFLNLFQSAASTAVQKAIETSLDVALDTLVVSVDEEKISDVSDKIRNQFKLTEQQNKKLDELQGKFKNEKPDSEEVMSFAYGVLSNNDYSDQDIIELAKNYLPDSLSLSDDMLLMLVKKYKDENSISDLNNYSSASFSDDPSSINKSLSNDSDVSNENKDYFENTELNEFENTGFDEKVKLDYFERTNSSDFDLKTIRWLRGNLGVRKEKDVNVLSISFSSTNPELSKLITNTISEEYLNYQRISKESAGLYSTEYYQEKIDELRVKQDNLSSKILDFESANDIYDSKVENLELDLRSYEDEFRTLEDEKNELLKIYTIKHPEVVTILSKIQSNIEIKNQLNDEVSISRSQLSQLNKYNSELKVNETLLSTYLNKLLTVSSFNESDARILEKSDNALFVNSNDAVKRIVYYLFFGVIISITFIAIVLFLDFYGLFNKFQINSQIKDKTGIDSTGVIPHFSNLKFDFPIKFDPSDNMIVVDNIKKIILKIISKKINSNAFVISSPLSSDGKTFIAILFSIIAKEMGKKVLLIDMDTEKTTLTKKFFGKNFDHPGYSNLRNDRFSLNNLKDYIVTDESNNIDIIPSGNVKNESLEGYENFENLIQNLSKDYDMIFCDTMPITYHHDSILISKFTNPILTIKHNSTPISVVTHIIDEYKKLEISVPNIIFNNINFSSKRVFRLLNFAASGNYGYGYGYGYGYDYGYGYGYGYGYDYGYGYGYGHGDKNKKKQKKWFIMLKKVFRLFK